MTHYHLLIVAGRTIDLTTKFYYVGVGNNTQSDRDYLFLTSWSVTHGYYFERMTKDVADFLMRLIDSLRPSATQEHAPMPSPIRITARNLVRAIKASEVVQPSASQLHNGHTLQKLIDDNYRASCHTVQ